MIAIGSDHGGVALKDTIKEYFDENGGILNGECSSGVLVCGTGIGMSIAANKIDGIRAAHVTDVFSAKMAKEHNDAQIICLGERITGPGLALEIVKAYFDSKHLGGRHSRRVEKIMALEKKQ